MSRSNDPGHYFQTSDSLATTERKAAKSKNKHGNPTKLPSKLLAAATKNDSVLVAEAAGDVKSVNLESDKIRPVFNQSNAPLTCIATVSNGDVYAGSWDKIIYHIPSSNPQSVQKLQGHTDFVKCLLIAPPFLISGGADATIIVWDLSTSKLLHKLKGHSKALQDFALDPLSEDSITLFSASSDREIRRWHISHESSYELQESIEQPLQPHETSIYKLHFDSDGDLWTASADKTAKHLVRTRNWEADTTLSHTDFVRDVLPFEELGLVVTACRDEEVRVWDLASGKLVCTYSGHFEEVTGLLRQPGARHVVVSVSIDGTLRRWSLRREDMVKFEEELAKEASGEKDGVDAEQKAGMLTAEEEAELAELMDDED